MSRVYLLNKSKHSSKRILEGLPRVYDLIITKQEFHPFCSMPYEVWRRSMVRAYGEDLWWRPIELSKQGTVWRESDWRSKFKLTWTAFLELTFQIYTGASIPEQTTGMYCSRPTRFCGMTIVIHSPGPFSSSSSYLRTGFIASLPPRCQIKLVRSLSRMATRFSCYFGDVESNAKSIFEISGSSRNDTAIHVQSYPAM